MTGQGRQVWRAINGFSYWRPRSCPLLRSAPFYTLATPPYTHTHIYIYICIYIRIYQTVFRRFPLSARQLTAPNDGCSGEFGGTGDKFRSSSKFLPLRSRCPFRDVRRDKFFNSVVNSSTRIASGERMRSAGLSVAPDSPSCLK